MTLQRRRFMLATTGLLCSGWVLSSRSAGHDAHVDHLGESTSIDPDYAQPLLSLAQRVADTMARGGEPLPQTAWAQVQRLAADGRIRDATEHAVALLQTRVLLTASINAESRVVVRRGAIQRPTLVHGGWRLFLVRIDNPTRVPGRLGASSPSSIPVNGLYPPAAVPGGSMGQRSIATRPGDIALRWLDMDVHDVAPLDAELEALPLDFKVLRLYARDAGARSAAIALDIGPGTGDIGGRDRIDVQFEVLPARNIVLNIKDHDGRPVTASLLLTDAQGRIVPSQTRRSPPDMFFQRKIYRADGQTLGLPPGEYRVELGRGPEYLSKAGTYRVAEQIAEPGDTHWDFRLERWVDPAARHWYSGDHHIHAAGCAHYDQPEAGVGPEMMAPQVRGEGLAIGAVLTWGPGFYEQKKHFSGDDDAVSTAQHILHYDLEVSGFPSSHCGHLALLQMKQMDYPGTSKIEQWPSSNAPVLRWARAQGAVTGYAHAGVGLWAGNTLLPNNDMPPFNGIGANDFIVTLPEGLVDFISICNHPPAAEMTIWYHTLNSGLRCVIAGETDWPCFFEENMGMGRSYVKLDDALSYAGWVEGVRRGRSYVSEGRTHLMDLRVSAGKASAGVGGEIRLETPEPLTIEVDFAARLAPDIDVATEAIRALGPMDKPYWHLERARIGDTRRVLLELIVNGLPVESRAVSADGALHRVRFEYRPSASCWIALRVLNAAHTNPVWVTVDDAPVQVKASAEWCRKAVDVCWQQKVLRIREPERAAEAELYDRARRYYARVIAQTKK